MYFGGHIEHIKSTQSHGRGLRCHLVGRSVFDDLCELCDKLLVCATTSPDDVHQPLVDKFCHLRCHRIGRLIVKPQRIGQTGIGICGYVIRCFPSQFFQIGFHLFGTERAIQSDGEDGICADGSEKGIDGLSAKCTSCQVADGHRHHDGQLHICHPHRLNGGIDGGFCVEGIEHGLNEQCIHTASDQCLYLLLVGGKERIVVDVACGGVGHIGTHRTGFVRRSYRPADEPLLSVRGKSVGHFSCDTRSGVCHVGGFVLQMIVGLGYGLRGKCVGGNEVGSRLQVFAMNIFDNVGTGDVQHVVVAGKLPFYILEHVAPEIIFRQAIALYHGTHGTVEQHDALFDHLFYLHVNNHL